MTIPASVPVSIGSMTKEQFALEMQKGMGDIEAGRVYSADSVEDVRYMKVVYSQQASSVTDVR